VTALLETQNVRVRFRVAGPLQALARGIRDPFIDAVADVGFSIAEGETFALVGESGSGKTTLARAILGLVDVHSGSIKFQGRELTTLPSRDWKGVKRSVAMTFQDPNGSLSPRLSVRSLITEPFRIHGLKGRDLNAECSRLLTLVGLPTDFADRFPHQLSGGQARRVGVARALALDPKLLLADEPTAGLDVSVQGEILNLLARLQDNLGLSMLIVTHNLNVVRHVTDRMAIMYLGRFVEQGRTEDIFHHPRHPYTAALLSANPTADPQAHRDRIDLAGEVPSLMNRPSGCEFHPRCHRASDRCCHQAPALSFEQSGDPSAADERLANRSFTCHNPMAA